MLRFALFTLGLALVGISGVLFAVRRQEAVNSARIAFMDADDSGRDSLYIMYSDGTGRRLVQSSHRRASSPTWSPDGEWIAFEMDTTIFRVRPDGSDIQPMTGEFASYTPAWSPDGEWIAFASTGDGDAEIFRMRPDGSDLEQLTHNLRTGDVMPAWSPDGEWIAYIVYLDEVQELYRMRRDGSEQEPMVQARFRSHANPVWSSDGEWVVFIAGDERGRYLFRVAVDQSQQPVRMNTFAQRGFQLVTFPSFSRDGQWLSFAAIDGHFVNQLYKVRNLDWDLSQIIHLGPGREAAWSPPVDLPWRTWVNAMAGLALLAVGLPITKRRFSFLR